MAKLRLIRSTWLAEGVVGLDLAAPGTAVPGTAFAVSAARAADTANISLAGADVILPAWTPGAHLTLHLADGISREYSLCGDPADRTRYTVAVQRDAASRGGSAHVHDKLRVGEIIEVDGPKNNFELAGSGTTGDPAGSGATGDAPACVLIAGGIGITPVRAMAAELARRGADWRLLYCGRTRDRMPFLDELRELGERDAAHPGRVTIHADDEAGGPADLAAYLAAAPASALVYCCGPEPLLDAVTGLVSEDRLRVERFRPPRSAAPAADDEAFDVLCSAGRFSVAPGTSILRTLLDAGLDIPYSCEEGICGSCETDVVAGTPDHRDHLLSDQEKKAGKTMMLCVSRCRTPELVLDL